MSVNEEVVTKMLPGGAILVESARGSAHLIALAPGLLLYHCTGFLSAKFYAPMVAMAQRERDAGRSLVMLVDGWELSAIDTGFREAWTNWFKLHKQHFRMHLLVRTKLMEMAASIANLFTGLSVITTYSNIEAWEGICRQHNPGFRRQTTSIG